MGMFDYQSQISDLTSKYAAEQSAQNYGRMLGQQRFKRQRQDLTRGYKRGFPAFTGNWAGRLGSNVQSGVFRDKLGQHVSDFNRSRQDIDTSAAQFQSQWLTNQALQKAAYQRALRALNEQLVASGGGLV